MGKFLTILKNFMILLKKWQKMSKKIVVDGKEYIEVQKPKENTSDLKYVIVRTFSAGVFAGYLVSRVGKEVTMENARRLWYWEGAASLSQLAMEGVSLPDKCKFPCPVDHVELTEAIEIIDCTEKAKKCIEAVKEWKA